MSMRKEVAEDYVSDMFASFKAPNVVTRQDEEAGPQEVQSP
jgi:hypothetical protein